MSPNRVVLKQNLCTPGIYVSTTWICYENAWKKVPKILSQMVVLAFKMVSFIPWFFPSHTKKITFPKTKQIQGYTPWKWMVGRSRFLPFGARHTVRMLSPAGSPPNHPFGKENDLNQTSMIMFHVNLPGCLYFQVPSCRPAIKKEKTQGRSLPPPPPALHSDILWNLWKTTELPKLERAASTGAWRIFSVITEVIGFIYLSSNPRWQDIVIISLISKKTSALAPLDYEGFKWTCQTPENLSHLEKF